MRVVSHESAAALHGLPVRARPANHLTVGRDQGWPVPGAVVHRASLTAGEVVDLHGSLVTSALRTVVDCARTSPFGWGLAVVDAALRLGLVGDRDLVLAARGSRGPGAGRVRRAVRWVDARAESPLESLTRALLIDASLGPLALQHRIADDGHPYDLHLLGTRALLECDGAEHHREHARFRQDCEHATLAARDGYLLLRLTWYDVTRRPAWTVDACRRAAAHP